MGGKGQVKSAQAYQVIGTLLVTKSKGVSEDGAKRALDYFLDWTAFDKEFLPWL
jgi:hypothetical protein